MKVTVVQPSYYMGENPDEKIAKFLSNEAEKVEENGLVLLPEYSNAGGISDAESELKAMERATSMLEKAKEIAKNKKAYVAINVLEKRDGNIRNSTYLFNKNGEKVFVYDKQHLPPSEVSLNVRRGDGKCNCTCVVDGIRFAFMTCYDVYFNEQIEHIASFKPDIILVPGYQRGERVDIIEAQAKLTAFRCNAFLLRSSFSMESDEKGGCSMIVAPDGKIIDSLGKKTGSLTADINYSQKHMRPAGFGGDVVRNDDFISSGLCPDAF